MKTKYDEAFVDMMEDEFRRWDHCLCPEHGVWYRGPSLDMPEMQGPELHAWFELTYGIDLEHQAFRDYHDYMGNDWFPCPTCAGNSEALEAMPGKYKPTQDMSDEDFNATLDSMFQDFDPRAELEAILSE